MNNLFLHEAISFDLLNLTLSYCKINGYFISGKKKNNTKIQRSTVQKKNNMSQGFCNLSDATDDCQSL